MVRLRKKTLLYRIIILFSFFFFQVLGFIPSVFIGAEQGMAFPVQAGFLSGKPPEGGMRSLDLNIVFGTAGKLLPSRACIFTDYYLLGVRDVTVTPRVQPCATEPLQTFLITLRCDGISQELNETFSIEFAGFDLNDTDLFPVGAPVNISSLEGTIIDQDGRYTFEDCIVFADEN